MNDNLPHHQIDSTTELQDMSSTGRAAAIKSHQTSLRIKLLPMVVLFGGTVLTAIWGQYLWMVFFATFACIHYTAYLKEKRNGPTAGDLAAGRLAESTPPELLSWEDHIDKYGPDDHVMKDALKTGEVDDPAFRKKHGLPPYDS